MTEIETRYKRSRCVPDVEEENNAFFGMANKRVCNTTIRNSDVDSGINGYPMIQPLVSIPVHKSEEPENILIGEMDIVSNFNTISFASPESPTRKKKATSPSSPPSPSSEYDRRITIDPSYPVFPPLRRAGRRIDHLEEELVRKTMRYNPDHTNLQVSIPPADFEFHMPDHVTAGGNPTTDARFLTSPHIRSLTDTAVRQATAPSMNVGKRNQNSVQRAVNNSDGSDHQFDNVSYPHHLETVTHSDWFQGTSNCVGNQFCDAGAMAESSCREDDTDEEEEDCDDMYIDS